MPHQPATHLPLRRALTSLRRAAKLKSLVAFSIFYAAYISLSTVRLDWWQGHETLSWLEEAHIKAGVAPLPEAREVKEIATYLDASLAEVTGTLYSICEACEVGLTPQSHDMTFLSLEVRARSTMRARIQHVSHS